MMKAMMRVMRMTMMMLAATDRYANVNRVKWREHDRIKLTMPSKSEIQSVQTAERVVECTGVADARDVWEATPS